MVDEWYYARDLDRLGPFSSRQLLELATGGQIRPTDTVWRAGVERGVAALKVKHLFPAIQLDAVAVEVKAAPPEPPPSPLAPTILPESPSRFIAPPLDAPRPTNLSGSHQHHVKKGRALAGQGAVIVGQDGTNVQYRKKCSLCNLIDPSKNRMPIRRGTTRLGFYCPKCRKLQPVEIQGII